MLDLEREYELETNASNFAVRAQLGQRDDNGKLHPVAYLSRKLTNTELNYPVHDKELLAIVRACEEWKAHLSGTKYPVQVRTDHKNLQYFATTKVLSNGRLTRWYERLSPFHLEIRHVKGTENAWADALSRWPDHFDKEATESPPLFEQQADGTLYHPLQDVAECDAIYKETRIEDDFAAWT